MTFLAKLAMKPNSVRTRLRSWLWQRVLGVPGLQVQFGVQILGHRNMRIGRGFRAGRMLWLEAVEEYFGQRFTPQLVIGERMSCSDSVHIACAHQVIIGNDVLVGSKVHITDHNHGSYSGRATHSLPDQPPALRALVGAPVIIGDRVFLADGVVVLPGSCIGAGTIVGANAVVSGTLPPDSICVGSPARPIKRFDRTALAWASILSDSPPAASASLPTRVSSASDFEPLP